MSVLKAEDLTVKVEELVAFLQERCLWQFASRAWDREENIDNVLTMTGEILAGKSPHAETPGERCHFANANHLASDVKTHLLWLGDLASDELHNVVTGAIARLRDLTVDRSLNGELRLQSY